MITSLYSCFQHWSKKGSVYIVSDTHFDDIDRGIMGYTISNLDQFQILKKTIHKNDTLIHLGDVGNPRYFLDLKCYKILIKGNHDQNLKSIPKVITDSQYTKWEDFFDEVYNGPLVIAPKIILSHEPIDVTWGINIHGHDHSGKTDMYHINLAPPNAGYQPFNLGEAIKEGCFANIEDIHRLTINYASKHSIHRVENL